MKAVGESQTFLPPLVKDISCILTWCKVKVLLGGEEIGLEVYNYCSGWHRLAHGALFKSWPIVVGHLYTSLLIGHWI